MGEKFAPPLQHPFLSPPRIFGTCCASGPPELVSLRLLYGAGPRKSLLEQLSRTGYGHNFGEQPGGGPSVQGQLIVQILKPLLDKCVSTRKELQAHENIVSNSVELMPK